MKVRKMYKRNEEKRENDERVNKKGIRKAEKSGIYIVLH
jgi:hypothetical protein